MDSHNRRSAKNSSTRRRQHDRGRGGKLHAPSHARRLGIEQRDQLARLEQLSRSAKENGLSDAYMAERFVVHHGRDWRFDHDLGMWRTFRDREHRWRPEAPGEVTRLAIKNARDFLAEARGVSDETTRERAVSFGKFCQQLPGIRRVVGIAQNLSPIAVDSRAWNADPWLVGAPNGVIDLRTGHLLPASREHLIFLSLGVAYDADATCPRWVRFLHEVFQDDELLIAYIQRVLGYLLTGLTTEQVWWLLYGDGSNGKSTFLKILAHVLGEYGKTIPFSMIERKQRSSVPDDVATLVNRRFIFASETIEDARLDEARIKMLTGSDRLTARALYGKWFDFDPTFKLFLSCNHQPVVTDDSYGFWRRLQLVPFLHCFQGPDRDDHLEDKLKAEGPGILAWMVQGCGHWQSERLCPPTVVMAATAAYRAESDHLDRFFADCCNINPDATCPAGSLYEAYQHWATAQQIPEKDRHQGRPFGERMARKFERVDTRTGRVYKGLRLGAPGDEPARRGRVRQRRGPT